MQDPLGMGRIHKRMVGDLVVGMVQQMPRAGYYLFYVWALRQARKMRIRSAQSFEDMVRDLERLLALSCVAHKDGVEDAEKKDHTHIVGSRAAENAWRSSTTTPHVQHTIQLGYEYAGGALGGYGAHYRDALFNLGLIEQDLDGEYERTTQLGLDLVGDFDVHACRSDILSHCGKNHIARDRILEIGKEICLCQTRHQRRQREGLLKLLFGFVDYSAYTENTVYTAFSKMRQKSLALFLYVINQSDFRGCNVTDGDILDAAYFGEVSAPHRMIEIPILPRLRDMTERWMLVKAHDNISFAAEMLLQSFLKNAPEGGVTLDAFFGNGGSRDEFDAEIVSIMNHNNNNNNNETPNDAKCDGSSTVWQVLLGALGGAAAPLQSAPPVPDWSDVIRSSMQFDNHIFYHPRLDERLVIARLEDVASGVHTLGPGPVAACSIALVILTAFRILWRMEQNQDCTRWCRAMEAEDTGVLTLAGSVAVAIKSGLAVRDFARVFFEDYVAGRALRTYEQRLRSGAVMMPEHVLDRNDDNTTKYLACTTHYTVGHRDIGFKAAASILEDLGLVDSSKGILMCTSRGQQMLGRVTYAP